MDETQEPQGTGSSAATELSAQEWEAQMEAELSGAAQSTDGDPVSSQSLTDLITGGSGTQAAPPPTGNPVWRKVLNLARGVNVGINNTLRTVAEQAVESQSTPMNKMALRNTAFYGPFLDAAASRISGALDNDPKKAREVGINSEEELDAVYGPRPSDGLGQFVHATGQLVGGAAPLAPAFGWASLMIAGGTAFDPYEESFAEIGVKHKDFIRKVPVVGKIVSNLASLLANDDNTSAGEARILNAVEGELFGRTLGLLIKPVVKGAVAAKRAFVKGEVPPPPPVNPTDVVVVSPTEEGFVVEARQQFAEPLASNGGRPTSAANAFQDDLDQFFGNAPGEERILRGTDRRVANTPVEMERRAATAADDLPLAQSEDRLRESAKLLEADKALDEAGGSIGKAADQLAAQRTAGSKGQPLVRAEIASKGGDVVELKTLESLVEAGRAGHATKVMQEITTLADKHGVTITLQASPFGPKALSPEALRNFYRKFGFEQVKSGDAQMIRRPGAAAGEFREAPAMLGERHPAPVRVVYSDEAAARSDAAVINAVAHEDWRASQMFTPDDTKLHFETADRLRNGDVGSLTDSPHFNLQSMGTSLDVDAQVQALTTQYSDLFSVTQGRPSVPNEVLHDAAQKWAAQVQLDNFLPALAKAEGKARVDLSLKAALLNAATKQAGQEMAEIGMLLRTKPGDDALMTIARRRLQTFFNVSEATANFNSELGRGLQATQARAAESADAIRFGSNIEPRASIKTPKAPTNGRPPVYPQAAAMSPEEIASITRLFARGGGDMRIAAHVAHAMRKAAAENAAEWAAKPMGGTKGKVVERATTLFINSIISGFKTFSTIALSGATMNAFRSTAKIVAGAGTANRALAEEGAAAWYSLFVHSRMNLKGAWAAFKENRSILDGTPPFHVDPNKIMKGLAVPGRIAGSLDEFTRLAAYRADEFAAAFRQARDEGLSLVDATKRAEYDLKQSFEDGMGLNPLALKRAGIPTLSDNLGSGTLMGDLSNAAAPYPLTKFAVPFIRPSVNTFRFAHANTPILNKWSKQAQAIFQKGGEEATVLHTQSALAGSMMVYAASKVMEGEITGAGPRDPILRAMWQDQGFEPYSVRLPNGKWISYRRTEPFATFLGFVADVYEAYGEIPEEDKDELEERMMGAATAVYSGFIRNTVSKSWTESMLDFLSAFDEKDDSWQKWLKNTSRGFVPYSAALRQFNDDPTMREIRGVIESMRAQIPGYSETLPARHNWAGEIRARQGDLWNRNFSPYPESNPKEGVEDILVDNFIRLVPPNPEPFKDMDMWDKQWARADGKVPYQVWMEKLAAKGVRAQVEEMVKSDDFTSAPPGTKNYPDSRRADLVRTIVGAAQEEALWEMVAEFAEPGANGKSFADAYINGRFVVPAVAKAEGQAAADSVKSLYGINITPRR